MIQTDFKEGCSFYNEVEDFLYNFEQDADLISIELFLSARNDPAFILAIKKEKQSTETQLSISFRTSSADRRVAQHAALLESRFRQHDISKSFTPVLEDSKTYITKGSYSQVRDFLHCLLEDVLYARSSDIVVQKKEERRERSFNAKPLFFKVLSAALVIILIVVVYSIVNSTSFGKTRIEAHYSFLSGLVEDPDYCFMGNEESYTIFVKKKKIFIVPDDFPSVREDYIIIAERAENDLILYDLVDDHGIHLTATLHLNELTSRFFVLMYDKSLKEDLNGTWLHIYTLKRFEALDAARSHLLHHKVSTEGIERFLIDDSSSEF